MYNVTEIPLWSIFDQVYRGGDVPTPCSIFGNDEYQGKTKIIIAQFDEELSAEVYKIIDLYREGVIVCNDTNDLRNRLMSFNNVFIATNIYRLGGLNSSNTVYYINDKLVKIISDQIEPESVIVTETWGIDTDSDWESLGNVRYSDTTTSGTYNSGTSTL